MIDSPAQRKIDRDVDCGRIIAELLRMAPYGLDSVQLTTVLNITAGRAKVCLDRLSGDGLVYRDQSNLLKLTTDGSETAEIQARNASIDTSHAIAQHREEALLGIVECRSKKTGGMVSERSKMKSAVLPSTGRQQHTSKTPEDFIQEQDRQAKGRDRMAEQLGVTKDEFEKLFEEYRIKICKNGCEKIGIFDRHGDRLQHLCRKCRKAKRREKR
jgi:hypothetical protein